jgi:hypothetical protein
MMGRRPRHKGILVFLGIALIHDVAVGRMAWETGVRMLSLRVEAYR